MIKRLASCAVDGTIKIWKVGKSEPLVQIDHNSGRIHCLAYSVRKDILASGGADGTTRLWKTDGASVGILHGPAAVRSMSWSSDGKLCTVETSHIHIWNVESCTREKLLFGHERMIRSAVWIDEQDNIVSTGNDATIIIWEPQTGAPVRKFGPYDAPVLDIALNRTANLLVFAADNGTIGFLELFPLRNAVRLPGHTGRVSAVSLSADGSVVASAGCNGKIRFWCTRSFLSMGALDAPKRTRSPIPIAFHPKRAWFAAPGKDGATIQIFDVDTQQLLSQSVQAESALCSIQKEDSDDQHFDVFLCHNSENNLEVEALARTLQENQIRPWIDLWHMRPGFVWLNEVERLIDKVSAVVVCVGPVGVGPWQQEEIYAVLQKFTSKKYPVIPVILSSCDTDPDLPPFLSARASVDLRNLQDDPIGNLIWGITGDCNKGHEMHRHPG